MTTIAASLLLAALALGVIALNRLTRGSMTPEELEAIERDSRDYSL